MKGSAQNETVGHSRVIDIVIDHRLGLSTNAIEGRIVMNDDMSFRSSDEIHSEARKRVAKTHFPTRKLLRFAKLHTELFLCMKLTVTRERSPSE